MKLVELPFKELMAVAVCIIKRLLEMKSSLCEINLFQITFSIFTKGHNLFLTLCCECSEKLLTVKQCIGSYEWKLCCRSGYSRKTNKMQLSVNIWLTHSALTFCNMIRLIKTQYPSVLASWFTSWFNFWPTIFSFPLHVHLGVYEWRFVCVSFLVNLQTKWFKWSG